MKLHIVKKELAQKLYVRLATIDRWYGDKIVARQTMKRLFSKLRENSNINYNNLEEVELYGADK